MNEVELIRRGEKLTSRRDVVNILADMLVVASDGAMKTEIVYKANLNFKLAKRYMDFLLHKGLVCEDNSQGRRKVFRTTDKGKKFLRQYGETVKLIE